MLDATPHKYNLGLAELTAKPYLYLSSAQNVPFFVTSALLFLEVLKFKERSVVRITTLVTFLSKNCLIRNHANC